MKAMFKRVNQWANTHEYLFLLLLAVVILRIPSLFEPFWYGDENIYLAIGQGMRGGLTLYEGITDYPNKPPAIYVLAALVGTVSNFRLLLLAWQMIGSAIFYRLAEKVTQNHTTAFFSSLAYVFLTSTPILEGNIANAEIFFIVPVMLGWLIIYQHAKKINQIKPTLQASLLGGIALGIGFLFKIHVALDISAVGLFFYVFNYPAKLSSLLKPVFSWRAYIFVIGILLPISLTLVYYWTRGVGPSDLLSNAAGSSSYVSIWNSQDVVAQTIGMGSLQARTFALGLFIVGVYLFRTKLSNAQVLVSLWLGLSLFAALLSARPYPHYLIQTLPPLILSWALLFTSWTNKRTYAVTLTLSLMLLAAFIRFDFHLWSVKGYYLNFVSYATGQIDREEYYRRFDSRMPRNYALAEYLRQVTLPEEKMYIWGTDPGVYVMSDRLPVEKLVASFHVEDLDYYDETLTALETQKPEVIVVMQNEWRNFPGLDNLLARDYLLLQIIADQRKTPEENRGKAALVYKRI